MRDLLTNKQLYNKTTPYIAKFKYKTLLNGKDAIKKTYHVTLAINPTELAFEPGDSVAVLPHNDPVFCNKLIDLFGLTPSSLVIDPRSKEEIGAYEYFQKKVNLSRINTSLVRKLVEAGWEALAPFLAPEAKEQLQGFTAGKDLIDFLEEFPGKLPSLEDVSSLLAPLLPRFYSISSTRREDLAEVDLLVALSSYTHKGEERFGIASHYLCHLLEEGAPVSLYVQPANHFRLPKAPGTDIIMVGPGTGIAPYRAFLQERLIQNNPGKNWLFFGGRHEKNDFFYRDFLLSLEKQGFLRLSTAFSRDQEEKVYVQHRLLEKSKEVFASLSSGAIFYVCGDATHMAKDVEAALLQIIEKEGKLSKEEAKSYFKELKASKRYLADVY